MTRLGDTHCEILQLEQRLRAVRKRRSRLALKLAVSGMSERAIARRIGVESPHINQWKRKAKRDLEATHA